MCKGNRAGIRVIDRVNKGVVCSYRSLSAVLTAIFPWQIESTDANMRRNYIYILNAQAA
jgi:hypothetical protein